MKVTLGVDFVPNVSFEVGISRWKHAKNNANDDDIDDGKDDDIDSNNFSIDVNDIDNNGDDFVWNIKLYSIQILSFPGVFFPGPERTFCS